MQTEEKCIFMFKNMKKRNEGKNKNYSISRKLRQEGKCTEDLEVFLNNLSLEEVIGLKLELATRDMLKGKFYGFPIWNSLKYIISDAVLKYALSATRSKREAARFLGIQERTLVGLVKRYNSDSYFSEKKEIDIRSF
tara:strand:- start:788 stop:1198 length:411 start_codon:yes stop_codon:yes gene_type:complete